MGVQLRDACALAAPHLEVNAVVRPPVQNRSGHDVVRICVFGQRARLFPPQLFHCGVDGHPQSRGRLRDDVAAEAGHKSGAHNCAVFVLDIGVANQVVHPHRHFFAGKGGQARREKEEGNPAIKVKLADFGQNRERRVVQDDASVRVVEVLIIAARPERPHDAAGVDAVLPAGPVAHRVIDQRRRVAVVGGQLRLELVDKLLVGLAFHRSSGFGHKNIPGFPRVSGFTAASLVLWLCTVIGSAARSNPLNLIRLDLFFRPLSVCGFCRAHIGVPHTATAFLIPRVVRTSASLPHRGCKPPFVPRWRQAAKKPGMVRIVERLGGFARRRWYRTRALHPRRPGKAAPIRLRLRTGTVAVRYSMPAFQPAGGAHIRDGASALGPCPWEVPMQSPKPKAARSLLPAAFDGTIIAQSNGTL